MKEQWFINQSRILLKLMESNPEYLLKLILNKEAGSIIQIPEKDLKKRFKMNPEQFIYDRELFWRKEFKRNPQQVLDAIMLMIREESRYWQNFNLHSFILEEKYN